MQSVKPRRTKRGSLPAALLAILLLPPSVSVGGETTAAEAVPWRWTGVSRVVAFGDVHGAIDELEQLLRATKVIDTQGAWIGGKAHLVSLGDLLDRGPHSRRVMDLLMRLEVEAARAGGGVHTVLGNHEVMNLLGDLRYVSAEEYRAFAEDESVEVRDAAFTRWLAKRVGPRFAPEGLKLQFQLRFPPGYFGLRAAFSPSGKYGRWLLGLPALVVIDDVAFVHGGLSPALAGLSGSEINRRVRVALEDYVNARRRLEHAGLLDPAGDLFEQQRALETMLADDPGRLEGELRAAALALRKLPDSTALGAEGPLWYRGMALNAERTERPNVEKALAGLGVRRIVLGHTPTDDRRGRFRFEGRVMLIDTGMLAEYYEGRSTALILEEGTTKLVYAGEDPPPEGGEGGGPDAAGTGDWRKPPDGH